MIHSLFSIPNCTLNSPLFIPFPNQSPFHTPFSLLHPLSCTLVRYEIATSGVQVDWKAWHRICPFFPENRSMRLRVLRVVAYVSKMSYTVTQKTWFVWDSLQKPAKKRPRKIHKKCAALTAVTAARPAKRGDLKSIYPFVFCEKNVIFQNGHKNCRIIVVNKLKEMANSMSRFSI